MVGGDVAITHKDGAGGPPVCEEWMCLLVGILLRTSAPVAPPPSLFNAWYPDNQGVSGTVYVIIEETHKALAVEK